MESLALVVVIVLFTAFVGGPTAILLTFLPDKPTYIRVFRTITVLILSLVGLLFGFQLAIGSSIPMLPRLIGVLGLTTSIIALLFEFKVLKHKYTVTMTPNKKEDLTDSTSEEERAETDTDGMENPASN
jgi:protein-S-isoprenylcysteine O-methyltransferase Ste14